MIRQAHKMFFSMACLFMAGASVLAEPPRTARAVPVEVERLAPRPIRYRLSATGSLEADHKQISSEVSGVVRELFFEEGDVVEAGKILATIDPERYRLLAAKAQAASEKLEAQAREAQSALARRRQLREKDPGWVSEEEILQHEARLADAEAAHREAVVLLNLAREDEKRSCLRSPFSGAIERRLVVAGQYVQAGALIGAVVDTEVLRLRFSLTEAQAEKIAPGQVLSFAVGALPGRRFAGTVFHVASQADLGTRTVECVARAENPERILRSGQFAQVEIETAQNLSAIAVPESALLPTDKGYVLFAAEGDVARERLVTLGLHLADGRVEILGGVSSGETIVTRGAKFLKDGMTIEYRNEK